MSCLPEGATGQEESQDGQQRERQTCAPEAGQAGGQLAGKQLCRKGLVVPVGAEAEQEPAECPRSTGLPPFPPALWDIPVLPPGLGCPDKGDLDFLEGVLQRPAEGRKGLEQLTCRWEVQKTGTAHPGEKRAQGDFINKQLMGESEGDGARLFSVVSGKRQKGKENKARRIN